MQMSDILVCCSRRKGGGGCYLYDELDGVAHRYGHHIAGRDPHRHQLPDGRTAREAAALRKRFSFDAFLNRTHLPADGLDQRDGLAAAQLPDPLARVEHPERQPARLAVQRVAQRLERRDRHRGGERAGDGETLYATLRGLWRGNLRWRCGGAERCLMGDGWCACVRPSVLLEPTSTGTFECYV
eukprot:SAG31_NODE_272_length_18690_cov_14.520785_23_plen_184_part_00